MLHHYTVVPARMDTLGVAMACLGGAKCVIDAGVWLSPFVIECTDDEAEVLRDILEEEMRKVNDPDLHILSVKRVS